MSDSAASSPLKEIKEYTSSIEKQGIVTILRSDFEISRDTASLRRTLSADMSSRKWLTRHAMKKVASSEGFCVSAAESSSSSSEGEDDCEDVKEEGGRREIELWSSADEDEKTKTTKKKKKKKTEFEFDTWSSILAQKSAEAPKSVVVPYVHPLVKKSTSSLCEKSLEICTESLGSETGSDGFSSYPPSEVGDVDEERQAETFSQTCDWREWRPVKFSRKKSPPRSFPPPLPSLSSSDGASVRMQSRRENGRLIVDAVSVPSQKNFRADRRDGRLVLSFVTTPSNQNEQSIEEEEEELEELLARDFEEVKESEIVEENDDEKIENDLEAEELEIPAPKLSSSVMNFHRLALMMKKPHGLVNRNSPWTNDIVQSQKETDAPEPTTPLAQSLPPRPPTLATATATAAASLNAYEYYWRSKPTGKSATIQNPIGQQQPQPIKSVVSRKLIPSNNSTANEKQQVLVLRGNRGDYLVPLSNCCKLPRRSLLLREPCCIATT